MKKVICCYTNCLITFTFCRKYSYSFFRTVLHPHPHGLRLTDTDQQHAAYCGKQFVLVNTMQNGGYTPGR